MTKLLLVFLSFLAVKTSAEDPPKNLAIFVLMGQSNMSGRGLIKDLPQAFPKNANRLWLFANAWTWQPAAEPLDSDAGQIDTVSSDPGAGVGPGLSFADAWAQTHPSDDIALVPCAKGGSSISQWHPSDDRNTLYGSCLARILKAKEKGQIKALLWYQGESDTNSLENATQWSSRFTEILKSLRRDLSEAELPVVYTQIAVRGKKYEHEPAMQYWDLLMQNQTTVSLPKVKMIAATGITYLEDDLHLDTYSQLMMGRRFAEALNRELWGISENN